MRIGAAKAIRSPKHNRTISTRKISDNTTSNDEQCTQGHNNALMKMPRHNAKASAGPARSGKSASGLKSMAALRHSDGQPVTLYDMADASYNGRDGVLVGTGGYLLATTLNKSLLGMSCTCLSGGCCRDYHFTVLRYCLCVVRTQPCHCSRTRQVLIYNFARSKRPLISTCCVNIRRIVLKFDVLCLNLMCCVEPGVHDPSGDCLVEIGES